MAAATHKPTPASTRADRVLEPFREFVLPGRRRTDHPLVVGTIVICLGLMTVASIVQITAVFWAGSQVKVMLTTQRAQADEAETVRKAFLRGHEAQALVLRRVCLNTAKNESDQRECLALIAPYQEHVEGGLR